MTGILNMAQESLQLGRDLLQRSQWADGFKVLRRLLAMPNLSPAVAAEANHLMAQAHFERADYPEARENIAEALQKDPQNPELHYLLAQSNDLDEEEGSEDEAFSHYASAARLAPADATKVSSYGRKLVQRNQKAKGLRMLEQTYVENGAEPSVVENFVEGLLEANKLDDAELVVTQAVYRNPKDGRFLELRRRMGIRLYAERSRRKNRPARRASDAVVLPFRNSDFGQPAKPRGPKKPPVRPSRSKPENEQAPEPASKPFSPAEALLEPQMTLSDILKAFGASYTGQLYENLGLLGKETAQAKRSEIRSVLCERPFLSSLIKRLPADSRKLLRTVVRAGGFVPASVLFQNTGPEAPPPDHAQPLLKSGLVYFGKAAEGRRAKARLVAAVPSDLLEVVASVLRVKLSD